MKEALECKKRLSTTLIKKIYISCAKTYISDMLIYNAMRAPEEDMFY
jgi:hypothetical protein